jgi:hypothetical protein
MKVPRPSKIKPEVESVLRRIEAGGGRLTLEALKAALAAERIDLSVPTLWRWRRRVAALPTTPQPPAIHVPVWLAERLGMAPGAPAGKGTP